ncbi:MAG: hypothetical protein J7K31_01285 [Candidatus Aenigmarchaeota archaeon]|nr:hypothetical protein [Candidatus Aenigmarchaeota archaeon]
MTKGYLYTMEVLLTVSMIFIAIIFAFRSAPSKPALEISLIKRDAFSALEYLDNSGNLRPLVYSGEPLDIVEMQIEDLLKAMLTKKVEFEVDICKNSDDCVTENAPENREVIVVDYYLSGYKKSYDFYRVRMYVWKMI